jgi:iron complex outermembrane receptor protein
VVGFSAAVELAAASKVYVNDANSDAAPGYLIANLRAGFMQQSGRWQFREFVRVNNLANLNYVGSVIVGDTNGRFFEPAATRNYIVGRERQCQPLTGTRALRLRCTGRSRCW